jgi:hypothetical protein
MKKRILALFLIIALLPATPVCAEIYKYVDEKGQKRWTDDLSQVPKEQRTSAQRIETEVTETADTLPGPAQNTQPGTQFESDAGIPDAGQQGENDELNQSALENEKADLDSQYQVLLEERKQLEQLTAEPLNASARAELNERITAYNLKTKQYEAQLNTFNEKIATYNQAVMAKQAPKTE